MEKRINLLRLGSDHLKRGHIDSASVESEIFLAHALKCTRFELYMDSPEVKEKQEQDFWQLISSRAQGFPLQYLLGKTEFMGLEFKMAPGVFIPRPETEILIEVVIDLLRNQQMVNNTQKLRILDIGSGCGNIAISLAKALTEAEVFTCDICDSALQLTEENANLNGVKINISKSNLFSAFSDKHGYFSLIISNPPYVCKDVLTKLSPELQYEPSKALNGGLDGLNFYRQIIKHAADYLRDDGFLAFEIGDHQALEIQELFKKADKLQWVANITDYNYVNRILLAEKITRNG